MSTVSRNPRGAAGTGSRENYV
ncbi:hypothetical protein E2C01_071325 [Portunus trituberculatus]|uniref:Uncharacterized protein n=1 Tax=Portunus trituberculatus TaxID=210409 RepID=A0A5B7HV27_PORTR|nr:hypothetical protein [Portunus trituberculatus]